jgi:hypothetical protein
VIKRLRFPLDIMLLCVRWYVAYPLSLRNLEEMMQECGVFVDHSTIHRWLIKLVPVLGGKPFVSGSAKTTAFPRSSTSTRAARTTPESRNTIGSKARRW